MTDINQIRLDNVRALADQFGAGVAFADRIDRAPTQVSRFMGKNPSKGIGNKMARHIEQCFNLESGWLDQIHENQGAPSASTINDSAEATYATPQQTKLSPAQIDLLREIILQTEKIQLEESLKLSASQRAAVIAAGFAACVSQNLSAKDINTTPDVVLTAIYTATQSPSA